MMRRSLAIATVAICTVVACSQTSDPPVAEPTTVANAATTTPPTETTAAATTTSTAAATTTGPVESVLPETVAAAMAEPGEYGVGKRTYTFVDPRREGREVAISVHYPTTAGGSLVVPDAEPNMSAAPYPVVMGSDHMADLMGPHLASHGFIFLGGVGQSTWTMHPNWQMVDYPGDLMVGLDGIESLESNDPLAGIAATDRTGVVGHSFGSWTALMLAGGLVNPAHYEATCASAADEWTDDWFAYVCGNPEGWAEMVERGVETGHATPEGLWRPMGDDRIRAAMPMGPEGFDLTGPDGLATITIPVLYMAAGDDAINPHPLAAVPLFDNTDPDLASMITFTETGHMMVFATDAQPQFKRFALAFFGYHLAGIDEYGPALTPAFVEGQAPYLEPHMTYETLVWGVHP